MGDDILGEGLAACFIKLFAFRAQRLPACALAKVFLLYVISRVAVGVVVVNRLFDRVEWRFLRHNVPFIVKKLISHRMASMIPSEI